MRDFKYLWCSRSVSLVLPYLSPFPVGHGRHGDGGDGCDQVYFNHAPVDHDENSDGDGPGTDAHKQTLEPQPEQRAQVHGLQLCFQPRKYGCDVDSGVSHDDPCGGRNDAVGNIEHAHDNGPGVGENQSGGSGFKYPYSASGTRSQYTACRCFPPEA